MTENFVQGNVAPYLRLLRKTWEVLERHGFPVEEDHEELPDAVDEALSGLIRARDDLVTEAIALRKGLSG